MCRGLCDGGKKGCVKKILLLILLLALIGCSPKVIEPESDGYTTLYHTNFSGLYRFIDEDAGVACWVWLGVSGAAGLDCLPLEQTRLER